MDTLSEEQKETYLSQIKTEVDLVKSFTKDDPATTILGLPSGYWMSLKDVAAADYAPNIEAPLLILQGEADFQISATKDFNGWKNLLATKSNVTYILYPRLNHLFMPTNDQTNASEYDVKSSVDRDVITDISEWVLSETKDETMGEIGTNPLPQTVVIAPIAP